MSASHLVLLGPPGAGKGTQAVLIARSLGVPHISTGEIFRRHVAEATALGVQAQTFLEAGDLVPDSVTVAMVRDRLSWSDARTGFVLDGFPRNVSQAHELDGIITDLSEKIDLVLELDVPTHDVITRLLHRAEVEGRADDTEDVIRHRMEVYASVTEPLCGFYAERGIFTQVDGQGEPGAVTERLLDAIRGPVA